ncbi:Peptidase S41 [Hyella patelloides LEGE 07179]|uniref:Peptidase S41 n=1 Tax=Hyella patelloides LEGE 07179 TaxID=945734 RepID=A0A563VQF9_9CYAN|nr:S41 family peptidase [Hyella patelloides]VEP13702.1 Peptidase S41 [Hyella patelloides LEGE 07179]
MKQPIVSRLNRWIVAFLLSFFLVWLCYCISPVFSQSSSSQVEVFESAWSKVKDNFFDPDLNGVDWEKMRSQYKPQAAQAKSTKELAEIINQMLGELNTSHTHFYTQDEPAYYQIAGIFRRFLREDLKPFLPDGKLEYTGIGIYTEKIDNKTFIKAIINGSPAEKAGLKVGDELLSVENQPFQAIQSFVGKADREVPVLIQHTADASPQEIVVIPKVFNPATMFLDAVKDSVEVIEQDDTKIGYIHIWSYADLKYQEQLETELVYDRLKDTDGLVWDIRDGWGGASPTYLNIFTAPVPTITSIFRDGVARDRQMQWQKPVVMLVNQGSRSGKEILAYGFRKYGVGQIVGSETAGAVVAGRPYIMPDGSLLYLAVADVYVDGERLEGQGIVPDVRVSLPIPYAQGIDLQKEQAVETVLDSIGKASTMRLLINLD